MGDDGEAASHGMADENESAAVANSDFAAARRRSRGTQGRRGSRLSLGRQQCQCLPNPPGAVDSATSKCWK